MANLAVFTAYPSFVGRHWTGLPRGCLIQRTYKRKNKTEPSNSTFLRLGSREAYAIESRTGSRYSSTSSRFYQLYTASLIHGERQTNKTQRAPVRDACMELDNPASVREPLDLLPTMDPGGENIWAKKKLPTHKANTIVNKVQTTALANRNIKWSCECKCVRNFPTYTNRAKV